MTYHRVIGDGCIWEGISLMNAWMLSVSVNQWNGSIAVVKSQ